jgi:hypothetical protein
MIDNFSKIFDLFHREPAFTYKSRKEYKNYCSIILTLSFGVVLISFSIYFGLEIIQRKSPIIGISESYFKEAFIDIRELNPILSFRKSDIDDDKPLNEYFDISADIKLNSFNFIKCNITHFTHLKDKLEDWEIDFIINDIDYNNYCIDFHGEEEDFKLRRSEYKILFSNSLFISLNPCLNRENCLFDIPIFGFYYIKTLTDFNNYTHPISYKYSYIFFSPSDTNFDYVFNYNHQIFNNNFGWLVDNIQTIKYFNFNYKENENKKYQFSSLFTLTIELADTSKTFSRSYMKIQDLFASIGGFMKALLILGNTIFGNYIEFSYMINLRQSINPIENKDYKSLRRRTIDKLKITYTNINVNKTKLNDDDNSDNSANSNSDKVDQVEIKNLEKYNFKQKNLNKVNSITKNSEKVPDEIVSNINNEVLNDKSSINLNKNAINPNSESFDPKVEKDKKLKSKTDKLFFDLIDFDEMTYFNYIYSKVSCNNAKKAFYCKAIDEMETLFDIYKLIGFLKFQYLLHDHDNLKKF